MQADRFTIKSQEALAAAGRLAEERRNPQLAPAHLLATLLADAPGAGTESPGGVVLPVLAKLGVQASAVRVAVEQALEGLPVLAQSSEAQTAAPGAEFVSVLRAAEREAASLGDQYVSTEHLLLALAADKGPAGKALSAAGAGREGQLNRILHV
jgi:ATP-dependent Clp protease ATP-binding subunit ClpB